METAMEYNHLLSQMSRSSSDGHLFCVVRFIESPFPDVNTFVCVPYSWLISPLTPSAKVAVAYPTNENSLAIRDRVKSRKKPNDDWRYYMATIEYQSDVFEDANDWIKARRDQEPCETENSRKEIKDSVEPVLNRKLRSASRPFLYMKQFGKPSVSVQPFNNRRKPLPKVSMRLPITENIDIKVVKQVDIAHSVSNAINCPLAVSDDVEGEEPTIDVSNKPIQCSQTGSVDCLDDKSSCEQMLPDTTEEDKSVMPNLSPAPELPHQNSPSPPSQDSEPEPSPTVVTTRVNGDDHEDDVADNVISLDEALYPGKTLASSPEQVPQCEHINQASITLVHNENWLPQQRLQNVPVAQSKAADLHPRTDLQLLTTFRKVPRYPGPVKQQNRSRQSVFLPPTSATHQSPRKQGAKVTSAQKRPHSQGLISNSSSPPQYITNLLEPSSQLPPLSIREKSPSVIENSVAKKKCIKNITRSLFTSQEPSTSTARHHLVDYSHVKQAPQLVQKVPNEVPQQSTSSARSDFGVAAIDLRVPQRRMSIPATQNPPSQAQYSHSSAHSSNLQHYLLMQRQYFEQMARLNSRVEQPYVVLGTDGNPYLPNAMTNQLLLQHYSQFGSLSRSSMQEVPRHKTPIESTGGSHANFAAGTHNFQSHTKHFARSSHNQSHHSLNNPQQRQYPVQYQDLPNQSLQSTVYPQKTDHQRVIRPIPSTLPLPASPKTPSYPPLDDRRAYLLQDPRVQRRLDQIPTERQVLNLAVPRNALEEAEPTTVNAEVQVETPPALPPEIGIAYQNPRTKKLVVNQATEVNPAMDADHCGDEAAESDENTFYGVDRSCQTDAQPEEEQNSHYAEAESEMSALDEYLDDGECESDVGFDALGANRPTPPQSPSMKQGTVPEEELLDAYGTLFTQMGVSFHYTRNLFKHLRNSLVKCAEVYESLVEKVERLKKRDQLRTSRAFTKTISERSNLDKINRAGSRTKIDHPHGSTFVLPPEYDPSNRKWTCKYQKMAPGLVELIPRTKVYVRKTELRNCLREAKDCRMLTRLLLTEVFSRSALSVCSLTGSRAKAFNSLNLDVRPGLDEEARMILLTYVERYGAKRGWKTDDTSGIISSMRTKILEIRAKYGQLRIDNEYQYAVVQFLELPYSGIDDFVCVPQSWIRNRRAKDRRTTVAFPNQPSRMIQIWIKKCKDPFASWKTYMAIIKYESYSYNDARFYIMEKKNIDCSWDEHSAASSDYEALPDMAASISDSFERINLSEPRPNTSGKMTSRYANLDPEPTLRRISKKMSNIPATSFRTGPQRPKRNIYFTSRNVSLLKNELLQDFPELDEDIPLFFKRLKNASDEPKQERTILKQQSCVPKVSIRQDQVRDIGASTSFAIQNQTNAYSEPEPLVCEDYRQAMSTQTPPRRTSEAESMPSCPNSEEHQDSSTQAMIVEELTEASGNEQPEETPENDNFASKTAEEIKGQSCQPVEEEEAAINDVSMDENEAENQSVNEHEDAEADQPAENLASVKKRWRCLLTKVFTEMDYDFSHACEITSELHQSFLRTSTAVKQIKSLYERYASDEESEASEEDVEATEEDVAVDDEETVTASEDSRDEKDKELPDKDMDEGGDTKPTKSDGDDDDDGLKDGGDEDSGKVGDDDKEVPKRTRTHIRTFVLPPEYDPNDTKWTLKHREGNAKLGLVELMPRSKVYINSIRLSHCKRVAKDSKTLARLLLVEIFTQSALSVCSLTGARANAFDVTRTKVRPGLDEHARMVILNFVEEHARQKNWGVFNSQSIINSIRSKIQEMRAKYGQTE